ncbi:MAG TPA: hypothetical protein DCZ05_03800 [Deltaproteobacteria bacterium]|nr:hypothetical protein [Deltaproteobacteria bacterium]
MNILDSGVPRQSAEGSLRVRSWEGVEKPLTQAGQKGLRCKAREKLTSGSVLRKYVGARQSSATKQMGFFQRSVGSCISSARSCGHSMLQKKQL